jgi:hypothetical protein
MFSKTCLASLALLIPVLALFAIAQSDDKDASPGVVKREVVVPKDTDPFDVTMEQLVRLAADGIAGSKIVADVDGPAKIVAENSVITVKGGHILIGVNKKEFVIKPTEKGKVKVKITVTPPQPDAEATVKSYEFEIK